VNLDAVKQLADLMINYNLSSVNYEEGDFKVSLYKEPRMRIAAPFVAEPPAAEVSAPQSANLVNVTAPVVGTAYRAMNPGETPLVSLGDVVDVGDALCVIEAMKIFSEITSPCKGTVVEIAFEDGSLAGYGAKLITLEKSE
jgi:biotin carboxyl carrier protein